MVNHWPFAHCLNPPPEVHSNAPDEHPLPPTLPVDPALEESSWSGGGVPLNVSSWVVEPGENMGWARSLPLLPPVDGMGDVVAVVDGAILSNELLRSDDVVPDMSGDVVSGVGGGVDSDP